MIAILLIVSAFIWNSSVAYSTVSPLSSFVSIVLVCAALALVPLSILNVVLLIRSTMRRQFIKPRRLLMVASLLISVGILATALWIGNSLFLLIDSSDKANAPQASVQL